jgi:hypothetical protein
MWVGGPLSRKAKHVFHREPERFADPSLEGRRCFRRSNKDEVKEL